MKFKYTILYVLNIEETLRFYTQAFGFEQSMIHESGDYGELNTGSTTLSFSSLECKGLAKDTYPIKINSLNSFPSIIMGASNEKSNTSTMARVI